MNLYSLQVQTLTAALAQPPKALRAWGNLLDRVGFDDLPNLSIRFLPMIYRQLRHLDQVPEFNRIRGAYKLNWVKNSQQFALAAPILQALAKQRVGYRVFKGLAIALTTGSLGTRVFGDIDIVVRQGDVDEARRVLQESGWELRDPNSALGTKGLGAYSNANGTVLDLHSAHLTPPFMTEFWDQGEPIRWRDREVRTASTQALFQSAIHHASAGSAESDLAQGVADFVALARHTSLDAAANVVRLMRGALAGTSFLAILAESGGLPREDVATFVTAAGSSSTPLEVVGGGSDRVSKALLAPRLIWRRRLRVGEFIRILAQGPSCWVYLLWLSCGQLRPIERGMLRFGLSVLSSKRHLAKGGPLPERDFRITVTNPHPTAQLVSLELVADRDRSAPGERERQLFINGRPYGFFPAGGRWEARYLLENPGDKIHVSLASNHRLPVVQFNSATGTVKRIGDGLTESDE